MEEGGLGSLFLFGMRLSFWNIFLEIAGFP